MLRSIGGPIFRRQLPERLAALRGKALSVLISPNGIALRGPAFVVSRVRGLLTEALTFSCALQTLDPEAQKLEKRLKTLVDGGPCDGDPDALDRFARACCPASS